MIVVVGDIAVDIVSTLRTPLVRGSDAPAEISLMPGGSGANVAVWLARLGQRATFVGRIGDDMFGRWLRDDLMAEGIAPALVVQPRAAPGSSRCWWSRTASGRWRRIAERTQSGRKTMLVKR